MLSAGGCNHTPQTFRGTYRGAVAQRDVSRAAWPHHHFGSVEVLLAEGGEPFEELLSHREEEVIVAVSVSLRGGDQLPADREATGRQRRTVNAYRFWSTEVIFQLGYGLRILLCGDMNDNA